jgi:hypothetical protein
MTNRRELVAYLLVVGLSSFAFGMANCAPLVLR